MMKTLVGVDPGAASGLPLFAGEHRVTRTDQFILCAKSRDQPVGNTRQQHGQNSDLLAHESKPENSVRHRFSLAFVSGYQRPQLSNLQTMPAGIGGE